MSNLQEAMLSLRDSFLRELGKSGLEEVSSDERRIRKELKVAELKKEMKQGYLEMGPTNLKLANKDFKSTNRAFFNYEARLAECD